MEKYFKYVNIELRINYYKTW